MSVEETVIPKREGSRVVFFCDGSARPNRGYGGYGIFGYIYKNSVRPKNVKHPIHSTLYFTPNGVLKQKTEEIIEVTNVLEVIHAINHDQATNNEAELLAFICSLNKALLIEDLIEIKIYTDSNYVVKSFNEDMAKWIRNNWVKQDGNVIAHNAEWIEIERLRSQFAAKEVDIIVEWVNGHGDSHGNNTADVLSVIGSNSANRQLTSGTGEFNGIVHDVNHTYQEYKKSYLDKDIMLFFRDLYFSSNELVNDTYCFLSNSENPNIKGRRDTTSIYLTNVGYVPKIVSDIKKIYCKLPRNYVTICCMRLGAFENKELFRLANMVNVEDMLVKETNGQLTTYSFIRETKDFLFETSIEYPFILDATKLYNRTLNICNNTVDEDTLIIKDITESIVKEGKIAFSNKERILDFTDVVSGSVTLKQKLLVTIGYDMPSYLALKNIEDKIQKVNLILEKRYDSNYCTLYVNIIMADRSLYSVNIENKYLRITN